MRNQLVTFYIFVTERLLNISTMMRRDVFQAIADPTRREIIQMVTAEPLNVNAIADQFEMSRPAISKHMKILEECGIVRIEQRGRERFCQAQIDELTEVATWVAQMKQIWDSRFNQLENYLTELQNSRQENEQRNNAGTEKP